MKHYVYLSYEVGGRMYIGSRSSECPEEDTDYFGSYRDKTFNPTEKKILKVFDTREEANNWESYLHEANSVDTNPKFANQLRFSNQMMYWTGESNVAKDPVIRAKISASKIGSNNPMCYTTIFRSPSGNLHSVECLATFAEQHGLQPSHLSKVRNGLRKSHRGWTLP